MLDHMILVYFPLMGVPKVWEADPVPALLCAGFSLACRLYAIPLLGHRNNEVRVSFIAMLL